MSRTGLARTSGMGFLRSIESGIEHVVDGTVGRVVRVSVQPVEIARKLAKELEDGKVESGGRTLVPSQYTVYLPSKDRERFSEYEASLRVELGAYLAEHVRREGYNVRARPRVTFETADELASGTFGIATEPETPVEPGRRSIKVEPAPVSTIPVDAVPEPVQEALPDMLVAPGLDPDAEFGPTDYEPLDEAPVAEPVADIDPDFEPEAAPEPPVGEVEAEPAPESALLDAGLPPVPPTAPGFPGPGPAAGPAPFLPVPLPPAPPLPLPSVDVPGLPDVEPPPPVAAPVPEPIAEPIAVTRTVSAAEAARAGLAHAADALVIGDRRYPLSGPVTVIGRSSACDVPLDDASASRRHAEVRRRGGKTVLVDLDSTNGTLVNGRRVREAPLRPGDRITIGTTAIVFERAT
jgi:Protein of unknown function (DUF3662)/FHA domain